jgi:hypothetical protein
VLFFVGGHGPPLLRSVDELLLEKGIARLFGALFALSRIGAIFFCFGCHGSRLVRYMTNVTARSDLYQPTSTITNLAAATAPSAKLNEKRTSLKIVMSAEYDAHKERLEGRGKVDAAQQPAKKPNAPN